MAALAPVAADAHLDSPPCERGEVLAHGVADGCIGNVRQLQREPGSGSGAERVLDDQLRLVGRERAGAHQLAPSSRRDQPAANGRDERAIRLLSLAVAPWRRIRIRLVEREGVDRRSFAREGFGEKAEVLADELAEKGVGILIHQWERTPGRLRLGCGRLATR